MRVYLICRYGLSQWWGGTDQLTGEDAVSDDQSSPSQSKTSSSNPSAAAGMPIAQPTQTEVTI